MMSAPNITPTPTRKHLPKTNRQMFSPQEDQHLCLLVSLCGQHWKLIAQEMNGRTTRQCRERYQNYLAPGLRCDPWTEDEDHLLEKLVSEHGFKWAALSKFFDHRSDVNVKNRWAALHGRNSPEARELRKLQRKAALEALKAQGTGNFQFYQPPTTSMVPPQYSQNQTVQESQSNELNTNTDPVTTSTIPITPADSFEIENFDFSECCWSLPEFEEW